MPNTTAAATPTGAVSRISWGSVIAGTLVAVMVHLTLSMLGLGIGAIALGPATPDAPFAEVGIGAMIWWAISILLALFAGGWAAGRLAGVPRSFEGAVHGILVWGLTTILMLYLVTTAVGAVVGGALGVVGQGAAVAWQGVEAVAPQAVAVVEDELERRDITMQEIREEAEELGARLDDERLVDFFGSLLAGEEVTPQEREAAVDALVDETDLSRQEAEEVVDDWIETAEGVHARLAQAQEQAAQIADDVAQAVGVAAFWGFGALILGALAAGFGGLLGVPREVL